MPYNKNKAYSIDLQPATGQTWTFSAISLTYQGYSCWKSYPSAKVPSSGVTVWDQSKGNNQYKIKVTNFSDTLITLSDKNENKSNSTFQISFQLTINTGTAQNPVLVTSQDPTIDNERKDQ